MNWTLIGFLQTYLEPQLTAAWPLAVLALCLLVGTIIRTTKSHFKKRIWFLHTISVCVLTWMIFQWNVVQKTTAPREITIFLDDSQSMAISGVTDSANRIASKLFKQL